MEDAGSHRRAATRSRGMGLDSRTSHSDMSSLKKFSKYILAKLWESREIKTWGRIIIMSIGFPNMAHLIVS